MDASLKAALWGLLAGSGLLVGAGLGWFIRVPQRLIAGVMAFGSGVLISVLALNLMEDAYRHGGLDSTGAGFVGGAVLFTLANVMLARHGARHRKRSAGQPAPGEGEGNAGAAIAIGALLDGVPESIVIGLSLLKGGAISVVALVAFFLSNVPEALSSSAGMKAAGRSARYVFGVWGGIVLASGVAAWVGYVSFEGVSPEWVAATTAVAAGAILAMLVDTMIPEAFAETHSAAGLVTVLGFFLSFVLSKLGG